VRITFPNTARPAKGGIRVLITFRISAALRAERGALRKGGAHSGLIRDASWVRDCAKQARKPPGPRRTPARTLMNRAPIRTTFPGLEFESTPGRTYGLWVRLRTFISPLCKENALAPEGGALSVAYGTGRPQRLPRHLSALRQLHTADSGSGHIVCHPHDFFLNKSRYQQIKQDTYWDHLDNAVHSIQAQTQESCRAHGIRVAIYSS
jgi:hypothetical protein